VAVVDLAITVGQLLLVLFDHGLREGSYLFALGGASIVVLTRYHDLLNIQVLPRSDHFYLPRGFLLYLVAVL
jgi:hypothetical protein